MASIPNLSGSIVAAHIQNIASLVNTKLEVSLVRCTPLVESPVEFSPIGPALSLHRRKEAEGWQQHKLACRLGFLFNDIVSKTPKLTKAFGTPVFDILRRPGRESSGHRQRRVSWKAGNGDILESATHMKGPTVATCSLLVVFKDGSTLGDRPMLGFKFRTGNQYAQPEFPAGRKLEIAMLNCKYSPSRVT